jgi:hypothetical protein
MTDTNTVLDEHGNVLATFTLDVSQSGASISFAGVWHGPDLLDQYAAMMTQYAQTLRDNGVN